MCLAVPMKVLSVEMPTGTVELDGVRRTVHLEFVEGVQPGDYVLVHAGIAVEKMTAEEAAADLEMLRQVLEPPPEWE